jgi:hypothetical protein
LQWDSPTIPPVAKNLSSRNIKGMLTLQVGGGQSGGGQVKDTQLDEWLQQLKETIPEKA